MKKYAKIEILIDFPDSVTPDQAHEELLRMADKWVGPNGTRILSSKFISLTEKPTSKTTRPVSRNGTPLPEGQLLVECGICGWTHPQAFNGDCRDDSNSFETPDDDEWETEKVRAWRFGASN